ncbi:unnamed protein product [Symbiodinium sp. CCMP2456]|nr:unnamed protein product [Symbiodinium sp. CCMP2456]
MARLPELPELPLSLGSGTGLPDLPHIDLAAPVSARVVPTQRGGGGELGVQAQAILVALSETFKPCLKEVLKTLGWNASTRMAGFLAKCTGLSRGCVEKRLKTLEQSGWAPAPHPGGAGRKRKAPPEEPPASLSLVQEVATAMEESEFQPASGSAAAPSTTELREIVAPTEYWQNTTRRHCQCPYKGLASLCDAESRQQLVGLRLACLSLKLSSLGSLHAYPELVDLLDSYLPGEFGELQHSMSFATAIVKESAKAAKAHLAAGLQQTLRALNMPSDVALTSDGVTTRVGESIQVVMSYSFDSSGEPVIALLDGASLRPDLGALPRVAPAPVQELDENLTLQELVELRAPEPASAKKRLFVDLHSGPKLVQNLLLVAGRFGVREPDMALRFAVHCGDGLIEGPFGCNAGNMFAEQLGIAQRGGLRAWGALDTFHACEKAGAHSDHSELQTNGSRYFTEFKALAAKLQLPLVALLAPVSSSTRTVTYVSSRVPKELNLIVNLPVLAAGGIFSMTESIENARRKAERPGKLCGLKTQDPELHIPSSSNVCLMLVMLPAMCDKVCDHHDLDCSYAEDTKAARSFIQSLLDPGLLLFTTLHFEHRKRHLLSVAFRGQEATKVGHVKHLAAFHTWQLMKSDQLVMSDLKTLLTVWETMGQYLGTSRNMLIGLKMLHLAWRSYPLSISMLTELMFKAEIRGVSLGIKPKENSPWAEPGTKPLHDKQDRKLYDFSGK